MSVRKTKSARDKDITRLLENVSRGDIPTNEALEKLNALMEIQIKTKDTWSGEVRLDLERERRKGVGEVVYCSGKSDEQLAFIANSVRSRSVNMAFSRLSPKQAELIMDGVPPLSYNPVSRVGTIKCQEAESRGLIAILTAGSSDVPIAEEAAEIAEFHGVTVKRFYDVGVAGLHRLLGVLDELKEASVLIVAAGMDGALPSVVTGLVPGLVIGLPTSVGYGVANGGHTALSTMLASCSPGLVVVNIDNGVGAALAAVIASREGLLKS
ncbi:MAG: nickel pincer cofactor biosynthesis protein LarB [Synergistaceae bacterium]|jgi:NCAIR mutase (PurE)-related protein|nr:nickel pincer cofactor biosynthesis protein LarB [Synergistaceae bacterium]